MICMHALFDLPIRNLMRHTCDIDGGLAFSLACRTHANNLYQSSERTIVKNSKTTQQRISCLLEDIDLLTTFEDSHFLQLLLQNIEAKKMVCSGGEDRGSPYHNSTPKKKTKPYSDAEDDLDDDHQDVGVDDSFYINDPAVPTPVFPMALSQLMNAAICAQGYSPPPGRHTSLVVSPTLNSVQLYEMAKANVNILGLTILIGNTKRVLDNARGYLNWFRITIPLTSPSDYEKTELTLVPGCPSLLQLTYPAIPTAIAKDFKLIEVQMEVEFYDSNKNNNGYISNVQDRIVGHESV